ncbi:MAG: hypothetical protein BA873_08730 [Desulfobulbaceae bacterium C00003063]|nr:MAG: hypothetical protein BA873_08730 [Desulfobulbaceae bacterium C00003063]
MILERSGLPGGPDWISGNPWPGKSSLCPLGEVLTLPFTGKEMIRLKKWRIFVGRRIKSDLTRRE